MKTTARDDWRVIITIAPRARHTPISALGFDGLDFGLDGQLDGEPFELTIAPRRIGDLGFVSMSDSFASSDIEGDYRRRCEAMLAELLLRPHVRSGRITCTETHTCSHCGLGWEELTAEVIASYPGMTQDEHSIEGEPVCCFAAIAEFRADRGIPALVDVAAEGGGQ